MIDNKRLYEFNEEDDPVETDDGVRDQDGSGSGSPGRIIYQMITSVLCLILIIVICKSSLPWFQWARGRIHSAINASTEATFGRISNSPAVKSLLENGKNLVQLQEITKKFTNPNVSFQGMEVFQNSVWPVQGSITRGFGWGNQTSGHPGDFSSGVEISAPRGADVFAVAGGEIADISYQPQLGWQIVLNHGSGLKSIYHYLDQIRVKTGQTVKAGQIIAKIGGRDQGAGSKLFLELTRYEQPFDPLSVLVN
jgi:murein DD-endopeptidase MepM/ murein hydrolase activator NlpD